MVGAAHALAREELIRTLTAYSGITTADGASAKNSLICSDLIGENDYLSGKSILIMSGAAQYETEGISSFNATTGEITFGAALSAQIVAGVSFRVLNTLPESVHITSGAVQIEGYDYISGEYRLVAVNVSGQIEIKATVADIVTARVSGLVTVVSGEIHVMSGQVNVSILSGEAIKISGETLIAKVSGEKLFAITASGDYVVVSGEVISKVSGETVIGKISGETIIAKVSGQAVKISGETVIAKVSGETLISKISGETVIGKISGETVQTLTPNEIRAGYAQITSLSGGTELTSGVVVIAKVRNLPGNDNMWLGPPGVLSGAGSLMQAGEQDEFEIGNLNAIYLFAQSSGQYASYRGIATP